MPRFQIKRKNKKPEPEVEPQPMSEEESESLDLSMEFDEDNESPTKPLNKKITEMKLDPEPQEPELDPQQYNEPQFQRPMPVRRARVARPMSQNARFGFSREPVPSRRRPMYDKLRSIDYPRPSRSSNGKRKLQYSTPYGVNGTSMTTQEKARRLFNSCFG